MWVGEEEKGGLCDSMDGDVLCVVAEAWMKVVCFCFNKCTFTICTILLNIFFTLNEKQKNFNSGKWYECEILMDKVY